MTLSDASLSPVEAIRDALGRIAGNERTGAQLRSLIDHICPDFDLRAAAGVPFGPGALTKFLGVHFPDLVHQIGKHGGDKLYWVGNAGEASVHAAGSSTPATGASESVNLWAAFASPGLRQQLMFDRTNRGWSVRPQGTPVSSDEIAIPPVAPEEFRKIAQDFTESAPADLRAELEELLDRQEFIYQNWVSLLKDRYPSHFHRWGLHRVNAITDLFRRRLDEARIPEDQLEAATNSLVEAQSAGYKERLFARTRAALYPQPSSWERPDLRAAPRAVAAPLLQAEADRPTDPRSLAILAINGMSITEIRQLQIPLGAIIDAGLLTTRK